MIRRFQLILATLLAICTASSNAAIEAETPEVAAGLSSNGPAVVIFSLAAVLLLTLVFRTTIRNFVRSINRRGGARRIHKVLSTRSKDVLDDFLLPGAYGGLIRIDHAVLTSGGILCIQAKHYNGVIFGDTGDPQWTNVDGIQRCKFLNPLIQNDGRTRALQKIAPDVPVASLIVFTGNVQFSCPTAKNVIHMRNLDSYIAKFVFGPCKIEDWDALWLTVKSATLTDEASRKDFSAQLSFP